MAEKQKITGILDAVKNNPDTLSAFLDASGTVIAVVTDENYIISDCSQNLPRSLQLPYKPLGRYLGNLLCPLEGEEFSLLVSRDLGSLLPNMLKLCYTDILYKCYAFPLGKGFLVLGDRMGGTDNEVLESMSMLNNELSALSRELGKKNREIEKANRKITELSRTDPLTGLANRRYFQERYEQAFAFSQRHGSPLSLVMMDIDYFKHVNDTHGHDAGDEVLKAFGAILKENCRTEDFPARFGGEEFIVFLPRTAQNEALIFGNRVRKAFSSADILENAEKITISAGIAELKPGEETPEGLIRRADQALYEAKEKGRNRCEIN